MTDQDAITALHIGRFALENILRLRHVEVETSGNSLIVSGSNGSGKTSTLDGLAMVLGFKPPRETPEPINKNASRGEGLVELCNLEGETAFIVERIWTAKGTRLIVKEADGTEVSRKTHSMTAQDLLDSFKDCIGHTPFAWMEKRPQDQVDDVLRICGVAPPVEEVTAIIGEPVPAEQGEHASRYLERLSADKTGLIYIRRAEANRAWQVKENAFKEFRPALEEDVKDEERDISGLIAELRTLQKQADQRRAALDVVKATEAKGAEAALKTKGYSVELDKTRARIVELKRQLADEEAKADDLAGRVAKGEKIVAEWAADLAAAEAAADKLPDVEKRIRELDVAISEADKNRQAVADRKQRRETAERLLWETKAAEEAHARLDSQLTALRELRANILNGVDLGVQGLEIGDGELRLDDVSFKQASQAQKIAVACALEFKRKPRLRVLWLDDGEHLDQTSQALLLKLSKDAGWQVIMSVVKNQKELGFEIVA